MNSRLYVKKAFVNHRENYPESVLTYSSMKGFALMGVEIQPFYLYDELDNIGLTPETIVCGYVGDVKHALKVLGFSNPKIVPDYPDELDEFLGRKVWLSDMRTIRGDTRTLFIKPTKQKLFTGYVKTASYLDVIRTASIPEDEEILVSEVVEFVSEYRTFIMRGRPIGIKHYKGDPFITPNRKIVESAIEAWTKQPSACLLDFGVTDDGRTLLIEANDAFAFGNYGLAEITYARILECRWRELVGAPLPPPLETHGWPTS